MEGYLAIKKEDDRGTCFLKLVTEEHVVCCCWHEMPSTGGGSTEQTSGRLELGDGEDWGAAANKSEAPSRGRWNVLGL